MSVYRTEVTVKTMPVAQWLERYCHPEKFRDACAACPDYGRAWSCPPGVPEAHSCLGRYQTAHLIGVKVIYDPETRAAANENPESAEALRRESYGQVKLALLEALLGLESVVPGSLTVAAGRCEQCEHCTRPEGLACRKPERMRYSFSAFGFDLGRMAEELLDVALLWTNRGLPEYNMALTAFLTGGPEGGGADGNGA